MKLTSALMLAAMAATTFAARADSTPDATGFWEAKDDDGNVSAWFYFTHKENVYSARLVKGFKKPGDTGKIELVCTKCTGPKKGAHIMGLTLFWGMKRDGLKYREGSVLDPRDGSIYHAQDGPERRWRRPLGSRLSRHPDVRQDTGLAPPASRCDEEGGGPERDPRQECLARPVSGRFGFTRSRAVRRRADPITGARSEREVYLSSPPLEPGGADNILRHLGVAENTNCRSRGCSRSPGRYSAGTRPDLDPPMRRAGGSHGAFSGPSQSRQQARRLRRRLATPAPLSSSVAGANAACRSPPNKPWGLVGLSAQRGKRKGSVPFRIPSRAPSAPQSAARTAHQSDGATRARPARSARRRANAATRAGRKAISDSASSATASRKSMMSAGRPASASRAPASA